MTGFFDQLQFWHWLILAALFAGVEMLSPGFFFIWLGGAALLLGLITLVISSMGWEVQLILFALFAAASVMAWYKFGRKLPGEGYRRAGGWPEECVLDESTLALVGRRWREYGIR